MEAYDVVDEFEKRVAEYAGAPYGVAVNSCTNALLLSLVYKKQVKKKSWKSIFIPKHTYVGVAYSILNAGFLVEFDDMAWNGLYEFITYDICERVKYKKCFGGYGFTREYQKVFERTRIIDSARRFTRHMYLPGTLYCLSFHETKILPIGDGGMILTDSKEAYDALRQMRFDGRTPGLSVQEDNFTLPAYHCHMKPDVATRGLMLMKGVKRQNEDLPTDDYPDLSKFKIFTEGI